LAAKKKASITRQVSDQLSQAILDFVALIPPTAEPAASSPDERARAITTAAALRASTVSGTLALPPGPAGVTTILPELVAVWRIQTQMVADIAGAYGKAATLSREQMLYCLFKHSAAQAVRDLVVRVGERYLIRHTSLRMVQRIAAKVGIRVTQRTIAKSVSRWLPVVGALGVAGYAYYDTAQVAATAIDLFSKDIDSEPSER
jgi:hypothetical protein